MFLTVRISEKPDRPCFLSLLDQELCLSVLLAVLVFHAVKTAFSALTAMSTASASDMEDTSDFQGLTRIMMLINCDSFCTLSPVSKSLNVTLHYIEIFNVA